MSKKKYQIELNSVTKKLPKHLHKFIVKQPYEDYTAQNQAVWRYVMRLSIDYLKSVSHHSYLDGISKTGISIDKIPKMEGMNRILKDIGWAAVSVDGFIPPNAFMEFQAHNVLVIASEIRTIKHITYTPAPDIIHEAAGHAPIIADPEYSEYLRRFGQIGSKAISSPKDNDMYEAIRLLSILKENPNSSKEQIKKAMAKVNNLQKNMGKLSEMAKIRNLHWWTVEYGLIGDLDTPRIYGAGLLSSIGESKECLKKSMKKIPYTIATAKVNFDITKPQPQLFVTPNFSFLSYVLEKFANRMALRKGGLSGMKKVIKSKKLGTAELSTGIQISGIFTRVINSKKKPIYMQTTGPTALSSKGKELISHSKEYHSEGFGSPIGKLEGVNLAIEDMSPKDLVAYGIVEGKHIELNFEGGVRVVGKIITGKRDLQGKILLISFKDCKVTYNDEVLFKPDWGIYDMAVGKKIASVFSGPASDESFDEIHTISKVKTKKIKYSLKEKELFKLYKKVRNIRENKKTNFKTLANVFSEVKSKYKNEWLILIEIYEIIHDLKCNFKEELYDYLIKMSKEDNYSDLINNGLKLIKK
ncbi:MAG: aromatic amino acid hydroxylase [Flavobacteriaceae bacterium]|jgi:phenylalanine-4-hydroxylase|nr:aromatic amino acid hydroxylase [Flavobacteriaceae bacterium]MBT4113005.1 aromatic amino acid hydroxylase [Flavobacteriaceae bacterium]MBT4613798.1 aromatic amino acid hydroxylase [Flavobacteriaceae bacterium]MBT5649836.1 aromatic amino acid hydroxylase [Flavobacteriaceae bacterium]MBT5771941.1 aromatic amino acid hydroxylase [Flavobacteriaceae bacterium]